MNAREFYRRYTVTGAQWNAMSDSGREYVRRMNRPALGDVITSRSVVAELLELAALDRARSTCPMHVKSGRARIARQIMRSAKWIELPS